MVAGPDARRTEPVPRAAGAGADGSSPAFSLAVSLTSAQDARATSESTPPRHPAAEPGPEGSQLRHGSTRLPHRRLYPSRVPAEHHPIHQEATPQQPGPPVLQPRRPPLRMPRVAGLARCHPDPPRSLLPRHAPVRGSRPDLASPYVTPLAGTICVTTKQHGPRRGYFLGLGTLLLIRPSFRHQPRPGRQPTRAWPHRNSC
jgi:hypothetical protein